MIKGMTGYGAAVFTKDKIKGSLEIKSQNHRYLDIVYYLSPGFSSIEGRLQAVLTKEIARGRVTFSLRLIEKAVSSPELNLEVIKEYIKCGKALKMDFGLKEDLSVADLLRLPGVVQQKENVLDVQKLWPTIEENTLKALASLMRMRQREGRSISRDTALVLKRMLLQIKKIEGRTRQIFKAKKRMLTPEEFLSFQKGADINEEITRLRHYIEEFKRLLDANASTGKKLDFVAQEMQRETNTIGSKIQEKTISSAVIALKSQIEKLREQAQNIE